MGHQFLLQLDGPRGVVLPLVDVNEFLRRVEIVWGALENLLESDLGSRQVEQVVRVELAEPHVDASLLFRRGEQASEAYERLFGGLPVVLIDAEIGEGRQSIGMIGPDRERSFEGAAGADEVANCEQRATSPHVEPQATLRISRARDLLLEQVGELGMHFAGSVEGPETLRNVAVRDVEGADCLECADGPEVVPYDIRPEPAGLVPRRKLSLRNAAASRQGLEGLSRPRGVAELHSELREQAPRVHIAGVLGGSTLQERSGLIAISVAKSGLGGPTQ